MCRDYHKLDFTFAVANKKKQFIVILKPKATFFTRRNFLLVNNCYYCTVKVSSFSKNDRTGKIFHTATVTSRFIEWGCIPI
jgi:hypothetical protein